MSRIFLSINRFMSVIAQINTIQARHLRLSADKGSNVKICDIKIKIIIYLWIINTVRLLKLG